MPETPSGSNPFRRKAAGTSSDTAPPPPALTSGGLGPSPSSTAADLPGPVLSSSDYFRSQLETLPHSAKPPPSTSFQKPKVVKRVRVQSPPPSSPESASGAHDAYPVRNDSGDSTTSSDEEDEEVEDPFRGGRSPIGVSEEEDRIGVPTPPSHRPPPNPFQKIQTAVGESAIAENQVEIASAGGKGPLDVHAFRQLLLTGLGGTSETTANPPTTNQPAATGNGTSRADAPSMPKPSMFDATLPQESPRTSPDISSELGEDDQLGLVREPLTKIQSAPSTLKKKPPPPSSRHGKLIKVDLNHTTGNAGDASLATVQPSSPPRKTSTDLSPATSPSKHRPSTPSDINKPLPPAPERSSTDGDPESIFDREAAGKVPEPEVDLETEALPSPRPPTPPNASHTKSIAVSPPPPRKPAPPPRRNPHARIESKASITTRLNSPSGTTAIPAAPAAVLSGDEPESARRASVDSNRSRSSSLRVSIHAPAPPPPRRLNHGSRQSTAFVSPSAPSFSSIASSNSATSPALPDPDATLSHPRHGSTTDATVPAAAPAASVAGVSGGSNASSSPGQHHPAPVKLSPPQPPPARSHSMRSPRGPARPTSVSSLEATSRRVSREKEGGAPPPPPRPRPRRPTTGGGSSSRDGADAVGPVPGEAGGGEPAAAEAEAGGEVTVTGPGAGDDILADLDALQREVDAMRGRYQKAGPGGGGPGN